MSGDDARAGAARARSRLMVPGDQSPAEGPVRKNPDKRQLDGHELNVFPDVADFRDYAYEPPLVRIPDRIVPRYKLKILDQGREGACTGFALAAVVNYLNSSRGKRYRVSPRMLYEMSRRFDEWPGNNYSGSSCRGAIKGWYAMGVCRETHWPYVEGEPGALTVTRAKAARETRIGAYYRLNHRLADFHAALCEAGVIFVSANVHDGWRGKAVKANGGVIPRHHEAPQPPGHAFALVGYDDRGFMVQNSWGEDWGDRGTAIWTYEDWFDNIRDAWVFRLSLSAKGVWQVSTREKPRREAAQSGGAPAPVRGEIAGHFVHIDDGDFHRHGRYFSDLNDVDETSALLAASPDYDHLLLYAHGGLNSPVDSARRIKAMAPVFKANRVYPYHFMYDTGLAEEIKDVVLRKAGIVSERVGDISAFTDPFIERNLRVPGRAVWREMKRGAQSPFEPGRAGWQTLELLVGRLLTASHPKQLHLVGHSTGAVLLAYLLEALEVMAPGLRVKTVSLMAPAATIDLYKSHYHALVTSPPRFFGIDRMSIYSLDDEHERDDTVAKLYRKSLLYLVSRAFEEDIPEPLLGMQIYSVPLDRRVGRAVDFFYSNGSTAGGARTASTSHGGFDNDPLTLNDILRNVLGGNAPAVPFRDTELVFSPFTADVQK